MNPTVPVELTQAELQALVGMLNLAAPLSGIEGAKIAGRIHVKIEQAVERFNAAQVPNPKADASKK